MSKKIVKLPRSLSVFTLAMINVAAMANVKSWPFTAEFGLSAIFFLILAALVFFFPVSLVSAELATGWPKKGGVYMWVREAFGPKWGFLAVWLQWVENVVWYPTILSFAASTIAYMFNPELAHNITYTIVTVLAVFWGATIANMYGMRASGMVSNIGGICGTLIPGSLIIVLGLIWAFSGSPLQIAFTKEAFFPTLDFSHIVFFTGMLLSFAGMEMSAVHATDVQNPRKNYPRAILLSVTIVLIPSIIGVLSIAMVIPKEQISLTAGTMQAFSVFLTKYNLKGFIPLVAALMAAGAFGSVGTWIIGPTKGLLAAGQEGHLPKFFQKTNKYNVPSNLLIVQALLTTVLTLLFLLMPSVSSGFWILTVLVAQLYLIMYIVMFAAALYLRYKKPHVERHYRVPGNNFGMWIVCGIGILGALFALLIGYIPPSAIDVGSAFFYTGFLLVGTIVSCILPFIILHFEKPSWKK